MRGLKTDYVFALILIVQMSLKEGLLTIIRTFQCEVFFYFFLFSVKGCRSSNQSACMQNEYYLMFVTVHYNYRVLYHYDFVQVEVVTNCIVYILYRLVVVDLNV